MKRREFIAAAAAGPVCAARGKQIARRPYKAKVDLSIIGLGGIVVVGMEQSAADKVVASSVERGINYFDVAPTYADGEAEVKLGNALKPFRKDVFLACKTTKRDAKEARAELERSLQRLHTDHFDLYQFHAVSSMKDVEQIFAPGGAAETFLAARKEGKARFLGFSAHHAEAALALMNRMELDSILFPVNFVCWSQGDFGPQMLAKAKEKGMARLALKAMAHTRWPEGTSRKQTAYPKCWYKPLDEKEAAALALRFTLSQDITAAIPPGDERLYELALSIAAEFRPLKAGEQKDVLARAKGVEPIFRA